MTEKTQQGKWIWYPDDFEIELSARLMLQRYERDVPIPPFWKQDSCWRNVKFRKRAVLRTPETIAVTAEGRYNVTIDGAYVYEAHGTYSIPAGEHEVVITVAAEQGLPTVKADGNVFRTDGSWQVTCNDHRYLPAAFNDSLVHGDSTPNRIRPTQQVCLPVAQRTVGGVRVLDFGRELFACVRLSGLRPTGKTVRLYFGESEEEAADWEHCELTACVTADADSVQTDNPLAFRYLSADGAQPDEIAALSESFPQARVSSFACGDALLERIYAVSQYTLSLTTREFILDGIKRDRWIWSGDAYQGYLMNYYCFFDTDAVRRTMIGCYGREPFDLHLNHIMDYTFYWIMGFCDYYRYTGDRDFAARNLSKAVGALEYCIGRTDENGLMKGYPEDWVFIDWADGLDNTGEVCFEQMLYCISLGMLRDLLQDFGDSARAARYQALYDDVFAKLERFWDERQGAYIHAIRDGVPDGRVLRYANIFAILYDLCPPERQRRLVQTVLRSDAVPPLTTPYMQFYESAALMKMGESAHVLREVKDYWGGMLREGATTFWETYDARQQGPEKYAMYGRRYGKSLCHTWGASPLYLIGRYVVGLAPANDGAGFVLCPDLAGLEWLEATLPFGKGQIAVSVREGNVRVFADAADGTLVWKGKRYRVTAGSALTIPREAEPCSSI